MVTSIGLLSAKRNQFALVIELARQNCAIDNTFYIWIPRMSFSNFRLYFDFKTTP